MQFVLPRSQATVRAAKRNRRLGIAPETPAHTTRPDVDNLAKLLLDAMVSAGWLTDDTRVIELVAAKRYAGDDETPGVELTVCRA